MLPYPTLVLKIALSFHKHRTELGVTTEIPPSKAGKLSSNQQDYRVAGGTGNQPLLSETI